MACCGDTPESRAEPEVWGPRKWRELHRGFRSEAWVEKWIASLPCAECRAHAAGIISDMPPDFTNADAFFAWSVRLHNAVNVRLGKPEMPLSSAIAERETYRVPAADEFARRAAICARCEHFAMATRVHSDSCAIADRALWRLESCPENKW